MGNPTEGRAELLKRLREQHQVGFKATQALLKELQVVHKGFRRAMQGGPKTIPELAQATDMPANQVLWHIAVMKKYGLVVEIGLDENYYRYSLAEETSK